MSTSFGARSGVFSTIFGFEKSMKWIIRDGLNGISRTGSGASIARGLKKFSGIAQVGFVSCRGSLLEPEPYRLGGPH